MRHLTPLEEARMELAARIYEALQDDNLDEGLGRLLKKAALPAAFAAGMASPVGGNAARVPAKIKSPQAVQAPAKAFKNLGPVPAPVPEPARPTGPRGSYGSDVDDLERQVRRNQQIPKRMKKAQDKLQTNLRGGRVTGQTGQGTFFGDKPEMKIKVPTRGVFNPRKR